MLVGDSGWASPYGCSPGVTAGGGGSGGLGGDDRGRRWLLPKSALPCRPGEAEGAACGLGSSMKYPRALIWGECVPNNGSRLLQFLPPC